MAKLTRANICYNLRESLYFHKVDYGNDEVIEYVFSSKLYKNKFESLLEENRNKINLSLTNRFGFKISSNKLCDLKLYITIEKRGFLIREEQKEWQNLNSIILDGHNLTMKS